LGDNVIQAIGKEKYSKWRVGVDDSSEIQR
jgi:hypothetical protein